MKPGNKSIIAAIALMVLSCGSSKESDIRPEGLLANSSTEMEAPPPPPAPMSGKKDAGVAGNASANERTEQSAVFERKLIKNGDVSFKTKSIIDTKKLIQSVLSVYEGYIAKENAFDYSHNPSEELVVRVPAKHFDKFLDKILEGVEEVDSKHIDIQDVSEEFVDIEARLKNKKQLEAKYQELLVKATNMNDILSIEREINSIREEIESTEGRLRYLSNQIGYSTLRINYYEHKASGFNFGGKMGEALQNGGTGFLWFLIVIVQLWPLWLVGGLLWWFIVWMIRRNRKNKV